MTELSRIAQTVLDYATSRAKRTWSEIVSEIHLAAGLRHWDDSWFDTEFPGVAEKLEKLLEREKGDALRPESVDPKVIAHLKAISSVSELKRITRTIVESLEEHFDNAAEGQSKSVIHKFDEMKTKEPNVEDIDDREQFRSLKVEIPKGSLQLSESLAMQISELLETHVDAITPILSSDAAYLGLRILKRSDSAFDDAITSTLGTEAATKPGKSLSGLLKRVVDTDHPNTSRLATQLALAYVDIAEFAASLDDHVTDEELEEIDSIRLECRDVLAGRIDATSDAIIEFEQRFSELIGMENVKRDLRKRVDFLMVAKRRAARGIVIEPQRMHMAFIGNPGTGKTTVARLFGQLLNNLGLLPSDVFVEKDRSGLVGTHVGHTEEKTKNVLRQAEGGVLFIDEAYALNDRYGSQKGFGEEAVDVLVKEMEDNRDRLVVILAGYKQPMEHFLSINPGLKSRIPSTVEFDDYSVEELVLISQRLAERRGLEISEAALDGLKNIFIVISRKEGFGNARDVENIVDAAQRNLVMRLSPLGNLATEKEAKTIVVEDLPKPAIDEKSKQIGFARHLYL